MVPDDAAASAEKADLRAELLTARRARSAADLDRARAAVRAHVLERAGGLKRVAAYEPLHTEPGSIELLAALHARGVSVLVPLTLPDRDLDWTEWTPTGPGARLGTAAIGTAGLVLVPALAVAVDGTRLGRGGGSYDRALARCAADAVLAALVFDDEVVHWLPRESWDVPVHAAVAPSGWTVVGGNTEMRPGC
ncbi:MAG: 5-formyltetrahydrofolate cyclo-ligase [Pseudonocardiales bacterium]|nr:5-formyltetrahydrofolate cyclo-ligase [Pseudonocardiales bacterium]